MEIIEVKTLHDRREFVDLPFEIYKNNKFWIPQLKGGEMQILDPVKNPYRRSADSKFWIVKKDGKVLGRIGAIIPFSYNEKTGENYGRITRPEFFDDNEVVDLLFKTAEDWIFSQGMSGITGPLGFANIDTQALLVEGFDQEPSVASVYHLPYYQTHFERLGYEKLIDWVEFNLYLEKEIPEKAARLASIVTERYNLRIVQMKNKKQMRAYGKQIFQLLNLSFNDLFSFVPFDDEQIDYILDSYIPVINPEFVHLVFNEKDEIVGFIIPVPSLTKTMRIANGKLNLRALISLIRSRKRNDVLDLFLTGVHPDYQSKGVASLLITEAYKRAIARKIYTVDTTGMIETNQKAIQNWKSFNHEMNKRKRCYVKLKVEN
ncbi:GNAT family N-acetyltransferase [Bacteroidales bacterium OttesenSCG-928-K22]|nr:GNAT family N-acetyltransferase [Bacteroidales bacterium OttesenSCG-928-K22]